MSWKEPYIALAVVRPVGHLRGHLLPQVQQGQREGGAAQQQSLSLRSQTYLHHEPRRSPDLRGEVKGRLSSLGGRPVFTPALFQFDAKHVKVLPLWN